MSLKQSSEPSELAITLAALRGRYSNRDGWLTADEVRGRLQLLGFVCSPQKLVATLIRMATTDAPWVERRRAAWGDYWEYRVTRFGTTDIDNRFGGVRPVTPWLPVYRSVA